MDNAGSSQAAPARDGAWSVLIVDDEQDIHAVTRIALRNKTWYGRPIALTHAKSGAEAREILGASPDKFQVAFVDVIMETDDAGLVLTRWIRTNCPRSLSVVLRTGQPDAGSGHPALGEFDVDFVVSKGEMDATQIRRMTFAALGKSQGLPPLEPEQGVVEGAVHHRSGAEPGVESREAVALLERYKDRARSEPPGDHIATTISAVVGDCVAALASEMRARGVEIVVAPPEGDLSWTGDAMHLVQVVLNVIRDIARFAYPSGPGRIEIRMAAVARGDNDACQIEFQDWGMGIGADLLPKIFDPFVTTAQSIGGIVAGLAATRRLAEETLYGVVSVQSEVSKGTTFTVVVPKEAPEPTARVVTTRA